MLLLFLLILPHKVTDFNTSKCCLQIKLRIIALYKCNHLSGLTPLSHL